MAAITEQAAYDRSAPPTIWDVFWQAVARLIDAIVRALPPLPGGNTTVIVLTVLLVALVIARMVLHARARREFWAGERRGPGRSLRADAWLEAQRLAASGAHLEAAHFLCASLLVERARLGELTLHHSKTTGDYARELRRRGAPSERDFQRFRARYDRVVYDVQACSPEEFQALLADARPLMPMARAA